MAVGFPDDTGLVQRLLASGAFGAEPPPEVIPTVERVAAYEARGG